MPAINAELRKQGLVEVVELDEEKDVVVKAKEPAAPKHKKANIEATSDEESE